MISAAPAFLFFALTYTGKDRWLRWPGIALPLLMPVATSLVLLSNDVHHLFWKTVRLSSEGLFQPLVFEFNYWFYAHAAYGQVAAGLAVLLLVVNMARSVHGHHTQIGLAFVIAFAPQAEAFLNTFGLHPVPQLDLTPTALAVACAAVGWGFLHYRVSGLASIAYDTVLNSMHDAVVVLDSARRVVHCNPPARSILGAWTGDRQSAAELIPNWDEIGRLCEGRGGEATELPLNLEDGKRYHQVQVLPLLDGSAHAGGWIVLMRDITERKAAERTIAEQRMHMLNSARLSSLGTMAAGIAHEINNPLAIIQTASDQLNLIQRSGRVQDFPQTTRLVDTIGRNVERITRIIRGLRNLAQDGDAAPFAEVPVDSLVNDTLELCRVRFQKHGIELDVASGSEGLSVECRATQVMQVLLNLLNNAFDAVADTPNAKVRLEVGDLGDRVALVVADNGPGVPEAGRERILDPFYTTKPVGAGMGLGLSISRSIAEKHRGRLYLEAGSTLTRFVLELPKRQVQPAEVEAAAVPLNRGH